MTCQKTLQKKKRSTLNMILETLNDIKERRISVSVKRNIFYTHVEGIVLYLALKTYMSGILV